MIELHISATSPEELIATINGLATLGSSRRVLEPAEPFAQGDDEDAPVPQPESSSRGGRRKKADAPRDTAPSGGAQGSADEDSAGAGQNAAQLATTVKSDLVGDTLSQQIKTANAEAKAERDAEVVTLEVVQQALAEATKPGGGMSMMKAQEVLMANFTTAAGEPLRRIREAKPEDYAAILAKFKG